MTNIVQLLTRKGTPCTAEEADALRDEITRLYAVASELRAQREGGR